MAYKTGVPQDELENKFTYYRLLQILAYKKIELYEKSKEDVRVQMLAYWICSTLSSNPKDIDPKMFELKWENENDVVIERTEEDMIAYAESIAKMYGGKVEVIRK